MSAVEIHCALGLNLVFHSTIYNRKWAYLSFKNWIPPQLTSALWSLFRLWLVKKKKLRRFFNTIAQFTNAFNYHIRRFKFKFPESHFFLSCKLQKQEILLMSRTYENFTQLIRTKLSLASSIPNVVRFLLSWAYRFRNVVCAVKRGNAALWN